VIGHEDTKKNGMVIRDLRIATRVVRRRPAFAITAVATIALGITATTAIYSVANAVLFRPLPFPEPDRVVHLFESDDPAARPGNRLVTRPGNYRDWKAQNQVFERMGAYATRTVTLSGGADADARLLVAHRVVDGYFETLGVPPVMGRLFTTPELEEVGGAPVAVLSDATWRSSFGGDPNVLGRQAILDNRPHTVIGVMPPGFLPTTFGNVEVWLPPYIAPAMRSSRVDWVYTPIARLKPGVTLVQARAELDRIASRVSHDFPIDGRSLTAATIAADEALVGPQRPLFYLLLSAASLLLLIAGVNVTNLLLARSVDRERELGVQTALGASPWQLIRQPIAEALVGGRRRGRCDGRIRSGSSRRLAAAERQPDSPHRHHTRGCVGGRGWRDSGAGAGPDRRVRSRVDLDALAAGSRAAAGRARFAGRAARPPCARRAGDRGGRTVAGAVDGRRAGAAQLRARTVDGAGSAHGGCVDLPAAGADRPLSR
jgi:hypothetical protein